MYKSFASCIASEVGADLDNIISTSILAALIKISDEIRSLKIKTLSPVYVVEYNNCIIYQERYDVRFRSDVQKFFPSLMAALWRPPICLKIILASCNCVIILITC